MSGEELDQIAQAAELHDVGKMAIPDAILKKPGPLDEAEHALIRRHPELGTRLLSALGAVPETSLQLVRDHHERLDGSGYPRGIDEEQLAVETRILTVCDVYDALISPRVYRPAWCHSAAMALLRKGTGTAFDTRCVDALEQTLAARRTLATAAVALAVALVIPAVSLAGRRIAASPSRSASSLAFASSSEPTVGVLSASPLSR